MERSKELTQAVNQVRKYFLHGREQVLSTMLSSHLRQVNRNLSAEVEQNRMKIWFRSQLIYDNYVSLDNSNQINGHIVADRLEAWYVLGRY